MKSAKSTKIVCILTQSAKRWMEIEFEEPRFLYC